MVVGAEHDDRPVEAALALVQVVGEVTGDVGRVAVGLDDDAVLVVAELRGAQPGGALGLEDVPQLAQPRDGVLHGAGLVQRRLVVVDVEVHAERVQRRLDLVEHQRHAARPEDLLRGVVGQRGRVGLAGGRGVRDDARGDLLDVRAAVAVLGRLLPARPGEEGTGEPVDLRPVVVEVVLARDLSAAGLHEARERVADGGPPGAADVHGPGWVRRDELEVDPLPRERGVRAVRRAGLHDRLREPPCGGGLERDVQEAGAGDVDLGDARDRGQARGEERGQVARGHAGLLAELEGDVRRPVAVLALPRSLDGDLLWDVLGGERDGSVCDEAGQDGVQRLGELSGGHRQSLASRRHRPGRDSQAPRGARRGRTRHV